MRRAFSSRRASCARSAPGTTRARAVRAPDGTAPRPHVLSRSPQPAGANIAQCTAGIVDTSAGQKCTIEQHGTTYTEKCAMRVNSSDASQLCGITQTGTKNTALVDLQIVSTNNAA